MSLWWRAHGAVEEDLFCSFSQALSFSLFRNSFGECPRACSRACLYTASACMTVTIPGCLQACSSRCPGRYHVGSSKCSRTGRYQVGSCGCSPLRMLLVTGRYQVGSGGCSPHRRLLGMNMIDLRRWMLFALVRPWHTRKVQFVPRRPCPAEEAETA